MESQSLGVYLVQDEDIAFLLDEHGYDLTLTRAGSGGTYDTATGTMTGASAPVSETIRGVFIEYMAGHINNTTILANDRKLLLRAKDIPVEPKLGDTVDGLKIVGPVRTVQSGDTVIAYTAQMRA